MIAKGERVMNSESDSTAARLLSAFFNRLERKEPMAPVATPAVVVGRAGADGDQAQAPKSLSLEAWPHPWQSA